MKIGDQLREARIAADLTQEALGFAARVDRSYISQLERNLKSPTLEMLARLCQECGVSVSSLILDAESKASARK